MVVDENMGEVLLTADFRAYVASVGFNLYFCRPADPESKGKVENVVGYVKKNFLYNRAYVDCDGVNSQGLGWLARTANHLPHNLTKKSPQTEHLIEQQHLSPHKPVLMENEYQTYYVRKNNTIAYRSNFYSLPEGTYQGRGQPGAAQTNRARQYFARIQERLPRYTRDHLQCILKALRGVAAEQADAALNFCLAHQLYSGSEFEQVLRVQASETKKATQAPDVSKLDDYESIINP